ncbi:uncharacterized protein [Diadema antillarum]
MRSLPEERVDPAPVQVSDEDISLATAALRERLAQSDKPCTFPLPECIHHPTVENVNPTQAHDATQESLDSDLAMDILEELSTGVHADDSSMITRIQRLEEENKDLLARNVAMEVKVNELESQIETQERTMFNQEERIKSLEDIVLSLPQRDTRQSNPPCTPRNCNPLAPRNADLSSDHRRMEKRSTPHPNRQVASKENTPDFIPDPAYVPYLTREVRQRYISDSLFISLMNSSKSLNYIARRVSSALFTEEERLNAKIEPWGDSPVLDQERVAIMKELIMDICKVRKEDQPAAWKYAKNTIYKQTRVMRHEMKAKKVLAF